MSKRGDIAPVKPRSPADAPRRGGARAISELLPDTTRAAFRRFGFVQSAIVSRWSEIVGERFAQVSVPESIRFPVGKKAEGTLNLVVRGAHGPMMQHIAPEIIERVNRFFGYPAVVKVAMRQGEVPARARRVAPPSIKPPVPTELGESLRTIADPELKAVLEALAAGVASVAASPTLDIPVLGKIK